MLVKALKIFWNKLACKVEKNIFQMCKTKSFYCKYNVTLFLFYLHKKYSINKFFSTSLCWLRKLLVKLKFNPVISEKFLCDIRLSEKTSDQWPVTSDPLHSDKQRSAGFAESYISYQSKWTCSANVGLFK